MPAILINKRHSTKSGFTIVEMLIIAPIVLLAIGAFITAIVSMTGEVLATRSANALAYNIQDALNRIEMDVKLSTTFLAKNNISPLTFPQGYDNDMTGFTNVDSNKGDMLILNTLATTGNPLSTSSGIVYLNGKPNDCAINPSTKLGQNTPMTMNVIYFVREKTLWRRTVTPSDYASAGCNTPWQQPSCSPGQTDLFCKTQDIKLLDNVDPADFVVRYYTSSSSTTIDGVASNPASPDDSRSAAMQSATTVGVSIDITKLAAGREINQSGAIRSTRLDVNASTIAPIIPAIVPATPTVTASIDPAAPTTATFTWASVPGAGSYTLDYRVDSWDPVTRTNPTGTWTNGFTNRIETLPADRTYSRTVNHGDKVYVRVKANSTNSNLDSSEYGNSNITIPIWASFQMQNNWSDYSSTFAPAAFTKTASGLVVLKGMIKAGTTTTDALIATLPAGYAPSERLIFENTSNQTFGRVDVASDGTVRFNFGGNTWFSLDGISFMPAGTSFNAMSPLLNGWVAFGGSYSAPAYVTDSAGRVHTKGLVASGTTTSGTPIATLPAGSRAAEYYNFTNINSNANSHISTGTSGNVVVKVGGNSFLSLQAMFYPSGRTTGTSCTTQWCNLSLLNGWAVYGGYTTPQYTKSSDGMVLIKGAVKTGNGAIANLPAGYCPKNQLLLTVQQNATWERLDITAGTGSGCSIVPLTMNTAWTTLDSISYLAEW